jgi:hypothetical protein
MGEPKIGQHQETVAATSTPAPSTQEAPLELFDPHVAPKDIRWFENLVGKGQVTDFFDQTVESGRDSITGLAKLGWQFLKTSGGVLIGDKEAEQRAAGFLGSVARGAKDVLVVMTPLAVVVPESTYKKSALNFCRGVMGLAGSAPAMFEQGQYGRGLGHLVGSYGTPVAVGKGMSLAKQALKSPKAPDVPGKTPPTEPKTGVPKKGAAAGAGGAATPSPPPPPKTPGPEKMGGQPPPPPPQPRTNLPAGKTGGETPTPQKTSPPEAVPPSSPAPETPRLATPSEGFLDKIPAKSLLTKESHVQVFRDGRQIIIKTNVPGKDFQYVIKRGPGGDLEVVARPSNAGLDPTKPLRQSLPRKLTPEEIDALKAKLPKESWLWAMPETPKAVPYVPTTPLGSDVEKLVRDIMKNDPRVTPWRAIREDMEKSLPELLKRVDAQGIGQNPVKDFVDKYFAPVTQGRPAPYPVRGKIEIPQVDYDLLLGRLQGNR